ncbi:MAG TPA: DEAD/DEAH box helicase family protein, partial [Candidatus Elarobacter sp.]
MELQDATPAAVTRPRRRQAHDHASRAERPRAPHLRPYQVEAQQAILEHRARGVRSQLVSLATGLGKSVVIATLPKLLSLRPGDVTVVVAHRDELIEQLVDKFRVENPDALIGVE